MKRYMLKASGLGLALGGLATSLAFAHPGHDHSHTDHAVHEMPAQAGVEPLLLVGALLVAGLVVLAVRQSRKTPSRKR